MKVTVIGSGYVGLVTAACLAEVGNSVVGVDNNLEKIELLKQCISPIWEPGLDEMLRRNSTEGRLTFTSDAKTAIESSDAVFIAVGTPPGEDGSADLQYVLAVARTVGECINAYKVVVNKSTVPIGTADLVAQTIREAINQRSLDIEFDVVSNPEFLKEGDAIADLMKPDRIVIGSESDRATEVMRKIYAPFNLSSDRLLVLSVRSSEMTKYAANCMLATKISFINEIAVLCEQYGADVAEVRRGIGSDSRIGYKFIYAGVGYGGSCFPKDVKALIKMAIDKGVKPFLMEAVEQRNEQQKQVLFEKIVRRYGEDLTGIKFCLWGLAFKPNTDDMREAPSIVMITKLLDRGAEILAFDPVAANEARKELPLNDRLRIVDDQYEALSGVNALVLITEWHQFRVPDFDKMKDLMREYVIFDGRNQYNIDEIEACGFEYYGIGRGRQQ